MKEQWKPVVGYGGLYEVSSLGRVRSYHTSGSPRPIKTCSYKDGYNMVCLHKDGKQRTVYVGVMVLEAFKGVELTLTVDHKDRNKQNDKLNNLRWATRSQNQRNRSLVYNSASGGVYGVTPYGSKWRGQAYVEGKRRHLGVFDTVKEASEAVEAFERRYEMRNTK